MNIVMINGTKRKESTYHIGKQLIDSMGAQENDVKEFFLPEALPKFCTGCANCFMKSEELCPHYEYTNILIKEMEAADVLIFTTPVYVFHASGQMKTMLDHFGFQWMVHRPNGTMFTKQAVVISTAAGGGMKSTNKDVKDSFTFWGVGKIYTYGIPVGAIKWNDVVSKKKEKINRDMKVLADKIRKKQGNVVPGLKVKGLFYIMRLVHKKGGFNEVDHAYWKQSGWLGKVRPWNL